MDDSKHKPADHLANERTFLAWVRTGVAVMAFGFVVVKFALFVKQLTFILNQEKHAVTIINHGYSSWIGIALVALGLLVTLLAMVRYKTVERQLLQNSFKPSSVLAFLLTAAIAFVGLLLIVYLVMSI